MKEYEAGCKAYIDVFAGMIRCTVLCVVKACNGKRLGDTGEIVIRLDETVGAYKKGEVLDQKGVYVVPRKHRFSGGFHYRIDTNYSYKVSGVDPRKPRELVVPQSV